MRFFIKVASIAAIAVAVLRPDSSYAGEIKRHILKNGLTVLTEESHKAPLAAIELQIKTGSAAEYNYLGSGISHFVEHMLFKGTKSLPNPGDIEKAIKSMGGYINAFTSYDVTGLHLIVPSAHLYEALEIARDIASVSLFDPDEVEKERKVILKEIRLHNDNPSRYLSQLLWFNMFKVHNYRLPMIGYESIFKELKREDLLDYYKTTYIPDNMALSVVGDMVPGEAFKKIEELFGAIKRVSPRQACTQEEPPQIAQIELEEERDVALTYMAMGFHSVSANDKDMFSLDVLSTILGGGDDARLFKALYKQKNLVYSIGSANITPKDPGVFGISAVLKGENAGKATDEIWNQIENLKKNFVTDKELEKAKNSVLCDYLFARQTVQEKASDLVSSEVLIGDYGFSKKYVERVRAVTKEDVREAAQKYLRKENSTLVKLIPRKKAAAEIPPTTASGDALLSNAEIFELKNKLKVIILEDHSLPIFSISVAGLGGIRTETFEDNGIAHMVARTLTCGTKKRSEDDLSSQIETLGASLNSLSGTNTFGLSASGLSRDFDAVADIFADVLQNPTLAPDKIEREKKAVEGGIKAMDDNIFEAGMRTLKYTLYKRHPYRFAGLGRISTVAGLTQKDLYGYYRKYYVPNNMVLAISGDIDKNTVKKKITALFEKFGEGRSVDIRPPEESKKTRPRILTRDDNKEQSLLLIGYLGTTIYSHDQYILQVLSSVLSGISGRLSKIIREELGIAYTLNTSSLPGLERGMIIFYVGTTKKNLQTARTRILKELARLKKEGITSEELRSAKNQLIGFHQMGLQRVQDVARRITADELYGLGHGNYLKYGKRINHITRECVLRAAKKYLRDDSYVLLTIEGSD